MLNWGGVTAQSLPRTLGWSSAGVTTQVFLHSKAWACTSACPKTGCPQSQEGSLSTSEKYFVALPLFKNQM